MRREGGMRERYEERGWDEGEGQRRGRSGEGKKRKVWG